jgi:hypothetical protein
VIVPRDRRALPVRTTTQTRNTNPISPRAKAGGSGTSSPGTPPPLFAGSSEPFDWF